MPTHEAMLLQRCATFASLDQHAANLTQLLRMQPEIVREGLAALIEKGVLLSEADVVEHLCRYSKTEGKAPSITSVGIPTRNRPQKLETGLRSFAARAREVGRDLEFVVADGSDEPSMMQANLEILSAVKREFGARCTYLGLNEREHMVTELAREADLPLETVRFAFQNIENCPVNSGSNRNTLLMATVGELTMQVDDDILCKVAPGLDQRQGMTLSSEHFRAEVWFHDPESMNADEQMQGNQSSDVFSLHESILGKSLSNCVSECGEGNIDVGTIRSSFARRGLYGNGVVLVSSTGLDGDSGIGSAFHFLRFKGASRARLVQTEEKYRLAMATQHVKSAVPQLTITEASSCPAFNLGLDNTRNLPPFMPVQRAEDVVFGRLLGASGEGYFGILPWMITHVRTENWQQNLEEDATRFSCNHILEAIITEPRVLDYWAGAPGNFAKLGQELIELGHLPPPDFEDFLQQLLWKSRHSDIVRLQTLAKMHGSQPSYWMSDVNDYLKWSRNALLQDNFVVPCDLSLKFGEEAARVLMQRLVLKLGELLKVWVELRQAATRLKMRGVKFARLI
jgi:hypothetical protein